MTRSTAIHERVAGAILDAAADLLADGGEPPSMNDVAAAAGVARATLYRYFPTRERLLQDLTTSAIDVTATRLAEADLDVVPVAEGIARVARVVAASGSKYAALVSHFGRGNTGREEQQRIRPMIEALLRRGIDDGTFRSDITADELGFLSAACSRPAPAWPPNTGRRRESRGPGHFGVPARHSAPQRGGASQPDDDPDEYRRLAADHGGEISEDRSDAAHVDVQPPAVAGKPANPGWPEPLVGGEEYRAVVPFPVTVVPSQLVKAG